jgi:hypothetical protein
MLPKCCGDDFTTPRLRFAVIVVFTFARHKALRVSGCVASSWGAMTVPVVPHRAFGIHFHS